MAIGCAADNQKCGKVAEAVKECNDTGEGTAVSSRRWHAVGYFRVKDISTPTSTGTASPFLNPGANSH